MDVLHWLSVWSGRIRIPVIVVCMVAMGDAAHRTTQSKMDESIEAYAPLGT